jgi:hypothetical protein
MRITRLLQSLRCIERDNKSAAVLKVLLDAIDSNVITPKCEGFWKVAVFQSDPWCEISNQNKYFSMTNTKANELCDAFLSETHNFTLISQFIESFSQFKM